MKATPVSIRGLIARNGGVTIGPIDLDLPPGAHTCLFGPDTAGASVLVRAVAGRMRFQGAISLGGAAGPGRMACLGPQGSMMPWGWLRAAITGAPGSDDPDAAIRARLARALAQKPALLLLDRVLDGCAERLDVAAELREQARHQGLTVLHATGRRDLAFACADLLVVLDRGVVAQKGSPGSLYERPQTVAIAASLGKVNVLAGWIDRIEEDVVVIRLEAGPEIEANPPDATIAPGDPCRVVLRPERISLSALSAGALGSARAVAAVVRDMAHRGDTILVSVAIGADVELVISRPAALHPRGLAIGGTVSVAWQSQHALTFPA